MKKEVQAPQRSILSHTPFFGRSSRKRRSQFSTATGVVLFLSYSLRLLFHEEILHSGLERTGIPCVSIHEENQQQVTSMVYIKEKILGREELWIFFVGVQVFSWASFLSHEVVDLYPMRNIEISTLDSLLPIQKLVSLEVMGGFVYGVLGCYGSNIDKEDELFCSVLGFISHANAPVSSSNGSKVLSTKARLHWCQKEIVYVTNWYWRDGSVVQWSWISIKLHKNFQLHILALEVLKEVVALP
ncbi:hypothetical protein VNO77_38990 [Canavalia gladiata]|uniref:Uncharacterized protein n=1 Tax=Canavalia gladiata TaxID=3824 RepID=A0AAN9PXU4_CANGL